MHGSSPWTLRVVSVSSCLSRGTTVGPASAQFPGLVLTDEGVRQEVNDRYGHEAGDRLLRFAAFSMAEAFRASDVVGRFGGDEFVAVLPGHSGDVAWATKRLASAVRTCNDQMAAGNSTAGMAEPFALSMSVGAARFMPDDPEPPETLLERADAAMYDDKQLRCRSAGVAVLGRDPESVRDRPGPREVIHSLDGSAPHGVGRGDSTTMRRRRQTLEQVIRKLAEGEKLHLPDNIGPIPVARSSELAD